MEKHPKPTQAEVDFWANCERSQQFLDWSPLTSLETGIQKTWEWMQSMNPPSQAVVLCGGLGTRLRPHTDSLPKPMIPCNGKPFLEYLLAQLTEQGITQFCLLTGYLGELIQEYFGDGGSWKWNITYSHGQWGGILVGAFGKPNQSWKSGSCYFILIICSISNGESAQATRTSRASAYLHGLSQNTG